MSREVAPGRVVTGMRASHCPFCRRFATPVSSSSLFLGLRPRLSSVVASRLKNVCKPKASRPPFARCAAAVPWIHFLALRIRLPCAPPTPARRDLSSTNPRILSPDTTRPHPSHPVGKVPTPVGITTSSSCRQSSVRRTAPMRVAIDPPTKPIVGDLGATYQRKQTLCKGTPRAVLNRTQYSSERTRVRASQTAHC